MRGGWSSGEDCEKKRIKINMKRLLCILSNMNAGGAETFLMKVYRKIDRTKYQFDFCLNTIERCFYESEIEKLGGKIYRIPAKSENLQLFKNQLENIVAENKYQYVLRITANAAGLMDLKIAKQAGADVCIARSSNSNSEKGIKNVVAHILGKLLYSKYVDVGFAPSELAAEYTFGKRSVERNKVSIIHNALDINVYEFNPSRRESIRQEFGLSDSDLLIGNIGRFMSQKNHNFIIEIFDKIHNLIPNAYLVLVGNGELENIIRDQVKNKGLERNVIFTGVRSDIPDILSAMDVMLMPSLYEGMPNTVIEAQATGLPCVISDSITSEANITGLVKYVPLSKSSDFWADEVLKAISNNRLNTKKMFIDSGYDIESVTRQFVHLVFGD